MNKNNILFFVFFLLLTITSASSAEDTGKKLTLNCIKNLKALNEATAKFVKETGKELPPCAPYKTVKSMLMGVKYLPKDPTSPTKNCTYNLVSLGPKNFQWYCDLHGVANGPKKHSFFYHEHKMTAKINPAFKNIKKYSAHTKNLMRWFTYRQTLPEKIKYQYNQNPLTTMVIGVIVALAALFLYKSVY